ncbi:ATPase [Paraliobacillus quinghaiensis]|uniref:ATPase n=1 Tax=Paraliobacillus quinghaiensis TaxID=470815 RepID=A0A917TRJ4_9BACI|nr:AAA family ATPase [Paraliobacillus quinghaiensis]GGM34560.1 ATPase [Paraliobacillus quinghaiensis]
MNKLSRNDFILNMIHSHVNNDRDAFAEDCIELIKHEEQKGNYRIAAKIRNALEETPKEKTNSQKTSSAIFELDTLKFNSKVKLNESLEGLIDIKKPVCKEEIVLKQETLFELEGIVKQWDEVEKLSKYNLLPQNKILFYGPPGTGKTISAYKIASELGLEVAYVNFGKLISSFLGKTGENISDIFDYVNRNKCVLLLDELDAIGKKRDDSQELGELKRIVISLLQGIDNFGSNSLIIACTNHEHLLDPALWRRFDNNVQFTYPGLKERYSLVKSLVKSVNLVIENDWIEFIAEITNGLSPAFIKRIVENGVRKWILNESAKKIKCQYLIVEEALKFIDLTSMCVEEKIEIAKKLRRQSKSYTFHYLSSILNIPKSTLHKKMKVS